MTAGGDSDQLSQDIREQGAQCRSQHSQIEIVNRSMSEMSVYL